MYRIRKDNLFKYIYELQRRYFGFFWITVAVDTLDGCQREKYFRENRNVPGRYTIVE